MADPLIVFTCHTCGRTEGLPLDTLQLIGERPFLDADGWRAERGGDHRIRCAECWATWPLAPNDSVEAVRVRPRLESDIA